jgi:hypothetical protein
LQLREVACVDLSQGRVACVRCIAPIAAPIRIGRALLGDSGRRPKRGQRGRCAKCNIEESFLLDSGIVVPLESAGRQTEHVNRRDYTPSTTAGTAWGRT